MHIIDLEELFYDENTGIYYDAETQKSFTWDVDGNIYEKDNKGGIVYSKSSVSSENV